MVWLISEGYLNVRNTSHQNDRQWCAGMHGSRTHHGQELCPSPVLKTGKPTGTYALPCVIILV